MYGLGYVKYEANINSLKFLNAKFSNVEYWVWPENILTPITLGAGALYYCCFEFHGDGTWEFTRYNVPETDDESEDELEAELEDALQDCNGASA